MKYILSLFLFVLILMTSCKTKNISEKNDKGDIIKKYSVLKKSLDTKHGKYEAFYDSGKPLETSTYKNGQLHGERILFFENGQTMIIENYDMDRMFGAYQTFYENGGKKQTGQYKDNKVDGVWNNYYENPKNQLKESFSTKDGKINGLYKEFASNGKLIAEGNKVEVFDGLDVFDGEVKMYDTISGKQIYSLIFSKGKMIQKDTIK